jgi:hypothetical protein
VDKLLFQKYLSGNLIGSTRAGFHERGQAIEKNTTYDGVCPDCNHYGDCAIVRKGHIYPDPLISYKINNYGYRSDDITKEDANNNFIFSGCSNTFGIGVPLESIWAHQVNEELGGDKFINLGMNSGSHKTIVYDIYSYIRNFGKPKGVFILFPNMERQIGFSDDSDTNIFVLVYRKPRDREDMQKIKDAIPNEVALFEFYQTVMMLEDYLEELEIPLVWTTWDDELNKNILKTKGFRNYVNMKNEYILAKTVSIGKPEKFKNRYWEIARDLSHMGTKAHMFYTQLFLDGWRSKYDKVI